MDEPAAPLHPNPKVAEALSFLQAAEHSANAGTPTGLAWAKQQYDYAIERLRAVAPESAEFRRWLGIALMGRANAVLQHNQEKALEQAVAQFDEALEIIRSSGLEDENVRWNDEANLLMAKGLALGSRELDRNLEAAVESLDEGIAVRQKVAGGKHPEVNHAVAVGWLSRADVLVRSGKPDQRIEAIKSFEEAIKIISELPFTEHEGLRQQLAMALLNRGLLLQTFGPEACPEAFASMESSVKLLKGHPLAERPEGRHLLAAALLNRGGLAAQREGADAPREVRKASQEVLAVLKGHEEEQAPLSEAGLRARGLLVRTSADILAQDNVDDAKALLSEATDAVDETLDLVRVWEKRKVPAFRPVASEVFRLGVELYQKYQPQFLAEFALETLDPQHSKEALGGDPEMYQAAIDAIHKAIHNGRSFNFAAIGEETTSRQLEMLQELRSADARLRAIVAAREQAPKA